MTGDGPCGPGPLTPAALDRARDRAERRAQALRDNLKRRKHQSAARAEAGSVPEGDAGAPRPESEAGNR